MSNLLGSEFARRPGAWSIAEHFLDGAAECRLRLAVFDGFEGFDRFLPASPPQLDLRSLQADFLGDLHIERASGGHQDQPGPLNEPLCGGSRSRDLLKNLLLLCRKCDLGCPARCTSAVPKTVARNTTAVRGTEGLSRVLMA